MSVTFSLLGDSLGIADAPADLDHEPDIASTPYLGLGVLRFLKIQKEIFKNKIAQKFWCLFVF